MGEDRKELVGWWAERMMSVRQAEETVRREKERRLDKWAKYVLTLEAARQRRWKKKLLSSRTRLAFTLHDIKSDRVRMQKKKFHDPKQRRRERRKKRRKP